jgi:membrane protease YdiL (CAAX protease family)
MDDPVRSVSMILIVGSILLRLDALYLLYSRRRGLRISSGSILSILAPVLALASISYVTSRNFKKQGIAGSTAGLVIVEVMLFILSQLAAGWLFFLVFFISGFDIPSGRAIGPLSDPGGFSSQHLLFMIASSSAILLCLLDLFHPDRGVEEEIRGKKLLRYSLIGILLLVPVVILTGVIMGELGAEDPTSSSSYFPHPDRLGDLISLIIGIGLIAPFAEEIFFRGYLYSVMDERLGGYPAVLITATIFSLLHLQPAMIPPILVMGIIMGYLRMKSGSIVPSLVFHCINNSFAVLMIYLS